jgi:tetratricopeptide (TPR) repeat protein
MMRTQLIILLIVTFTIRYTKAQDISTLESAFAQSYSFENEKNYTDAIDAMLKVYDEKKYEINLRLGWLHFESKKYAESVNYYKKAISLKPSSIEAKLGIANPLYSQGSLDALVDVYNDILKIDPNQVTVNYRLGLIFYNRSKFSDAKKYFEKYLELYPFDYDAVSINAWNNLKLGNKMVAKELFSRALLLFPKNAESLEGLNLCK